MSKSFLFIFSFSFIISACKEDSALQENTNRRSFLKEEIKINTEIDIPVTLWERIEGVHSNEDFSIGGEEGADKEAVVEKNIESDSEKVRRIPIRLSTFLVKLEELDKGTLKKEKIELSFSSGGGGLDLSDYIMSDIGRFKMQVALKEPDGGLDKIKVFYWPNGKKRKTKEGIIGSGCGEKILDVTSYFSNNVFGEGMIVTLDNKKYITVLAGTYVFVGKASEIKNGDLYIAQLTIRDSRFKILQCRE